MGGRAVLRDFVTSRHRRNSSAPAPGLVLIAVLLAALASPTMGWASGSLFIPLDGAEVAPALSPGRIEVEDYWEGLSLRREYVRYDFDVLDSVGDEATPIILDFLGESHVALLSYQEDPDRGTRIWQGELAGVEGSRVLLIQSTRAPNRFSGLAADARYSITGQIRIDRAVYSIRKVGLPGVHAIEEVDFAAISLPCLSN